MSTSTSLDASLVEGLAKYDGDIERPVGRHEADVIDAVARGHGRRRHTDRSAVRDRDPDQGSFADEIIAEPIDLDVGQHASVADFRINLDQLALARIGRAGVACAGQHPLTNQHGAAFGDLGGMALGQRQAEEIASAGDGRDRVAGQYDRSRRDRDRQHTTGFRRDDLALDALLGKDGAARLGGRELICQHIDLSLELIEPALGRGSGIEQLLRSVEIDAGVVELRCDRLDLGLGRINLQGDLVVDDGGDHLAFVDFGTFRHRNGGHRAGDSGAGRNQMATFDLAEDRLQFLNARRGDREFGRARAVDQPARNR